LIKWRDLKRPIVAVWLRVGVQGWGSGLGFRVGVQGWGLGVLGLGLRPVVRPAALNPASHIALVLPFPENEMDNKTS